MAHQVLRQRRKLCLFQDPFQDFLAYGEAFRVSNSNVGCDTSAFRLSLQARDDSVLSHIECAALDIESLGVLVTGPHRYKSC